MYVLEVIPLAKNAPAEALSYRSKTALPAGALVEIPLRKKTVLGLVIGSQPVQEAKALLKTASFTLSKAATERGMLAPAYRTATETVATYHATTIGSVMASILLPVITEDVPTRLAHGSGYKENRVEDLRTAREDAYEKLFDEGTTLLVVPTLAEARSYAKRYAAHKPLSITSTLTPKRREQTLLKATTDRELKLVITTPTFSFVPLPNLSHILVERVSAGSYVLPKRPYIDMRIALAELAHAREVPVTFGDYPLPLEYRKNPRKPLARESAAPVQILDARTARDVQERWRALPKPILARIENTLKSLGTIVVLAARRGYAPSVVCRDCGTTVTDEYGRTLSLTMQGGTRTFRSADGRTIIDIDGKKVLCKNCASWNLQPLGIGIERVIEELTAAFPSIPILQVDADTLSAKTTKELSTSQTGPRIIAGTETMLPWLSTHDESQADLGVIASADSLLAVPFWRARERFVRIGLMLRERTKELIVVTRQSEDAALSAIEHPTSSLFWEEELGLRKLLSYPPFGTLIAFHIEASPDRIETAQKFIAEACAPHTIVILPQRLIGKNAYKGVSVVQFPQGAWPDPHIAERLAFLPPFVRVHVDSETFF